MHEVIKKRLTQINLAGFSLVVLLLGTTALGCWYWPLNATRLEIAGKMKQKQGDLQRLTSLSASLQQQEDKLRNPQQQLEQMEAMIPNSSAMDSLVKDISQVAEKSGLTVDGFSPHNPVKNGSYYVRPLEINGTGSWQNCYQFLSGLRAMKRIARLDDLAIDLIPDNSGNHNLTQKSTRCKLSITISTFSHGES